MFFLIQGFFSSDQLYYIATSTLPFSVRPAMRYDDPNQHNEMEHYEEKIMNWCTAG